MHKFLEFETKLDFWKFALKFIESVEFDNMGLSGGSAAKILERLSQEMLLDTAVYLIDERKIDIQSPYSNCGYIRKKLNKDSVFCPYHDTNFLDHIPESLDLLIMGVGSDGHIGSLFSDQDTYDQNILVNTKTENFEVRERISLSMEYLLKSRKVLCLIIGESKKEIWNKLKSDQNTESPIEIFAKNFPGEITFCFLD